MMIMILIMVTHNDNPDPDHDDHQLPQSHLDQGGGRVSGPGAFGNIVPRRERGEWAPLPF